MKFSRLSLVAAGATLVVILGLTAAVILTVRDRNRVENELTTTLSDLRRSLDDSSRRVDSLLSDLERAQAQISALQQTLEDTRSQLRLFRRADESSKAVEVNPQPLAPKSTQETIEPDDKTEAEIP